MTVITLVTYYKKHLGLMNTGNNYLLYFIIYLILNFRLPDNSNKN